MQVIVALTLVAASIPVVLAAGYLLLLVLLSSRPRPPAADLSKRFRIVVPAHDEELGIANTIANLRALAYPPERFSICVVADNCRDGTAEQARRAGAEVLERRDEQLRGKGYALLHAFERLPPDVDAVVVIDADTLVSSNLLSSFAARLAAGALAVQADYAVLNPQQSWRTRLMAIAFGSFHIVRSRGRERMSLSAGLRGNGMCFSKYVLEQVPHDAFSIVEDVEYGIRLGERGIRVVYADEAHVYGEMVSSADAASSQRKRWEGGRAALRKSHGWRLLKAGLRQKSPLLFDLGFDLLLPPLSRLALAASAGLALAGCLTWAFGGLNALVLVSFGFSVASVVAYVLRGWSVSGTGARGLVDLALAPVYVAWKLTLRSSTPKGADAPWVRTTREAEGRGSAPH
jgi:1,2-diacylglycerol 3-beta-glucosyltransferase